MEPRTSTNTTSFNSSTYTYRKPNIISSRSFTVEPSNYYSGYKASSRAQTVTPGYSSSRYTGSGYSGYFGRSNVARSQDNKPSSTWYKPSRSELYCTVRY